MPYFSKIIANLHQLSRIWQDFKENFENFLQNSTFFSETQEIFWETQESCRNSSQNYQETQYYEENQIRASQKTAKKPHCFIKSKRAL